MAIRLATLEVVLQGQIGDFLKKMDQANSKLDTFAAKSKDLGQQSQKMGLQFAAMGAAIAVPLGLISRAVIKTGADFEQTMRNVQSVLGETGAAGQQTFETLSEFAKEMGRSTVFSARQAGEALYFLASAGQSAQEQMQSLEPILNFAAATQSELASATEIVVSQLNAFGLAADQAGRVSNVLAAGISASQLTAERLGIALPFVSSTASAMGISIEETVGVLGTLVSAGVRASSAGRLLGTSLLKLTDISSEGQATLAKMGLTAQDLNPQLHSMAEIVGKLEKAHLGAEEAMAIFGAEGTRVWLTLAQQGGERVAELTEKITDTDKAAEMAAIQLNSFSGAGRLLKSAIEDIEITIFEALRDDLVALVTKIRDVVVAFAKFADEHRALVRAIGLFIGVGGGAVAMIALIGGGMLILAGQVLQSVTALNQFRHVAKANFIPTLTAIATKLIVVVGLLSALAIGLEVGNYINQWDGFRTQVQRTFATMAWGYNKVKALMGNEDAKRQAEIYWRIVSGEDPVTGDPYVARTVERVSLVDTAINAIGNLMHGGAKAAGEMAAGLKEVAEAMDEVSGKTPAGGVDAPAEEPEFIGPPAPTEDMERARASAQRNFMERRGQYAELFDMVKTERDAIIESHGTRADLLAYASEEDLAYYNQLEGLMGRYHDQLSNPTPWEQMQKQMAAASDFGQIGFQTLMSAADGLGNIVGTGLVNAFGKATSTMGRFFQSLMADLTAAIVKALILKTILEIFGTGGGGPAPSFMSLLTGGFQSPGPDFFARFEGGRFASLFMQGIKREMAPVAGSAGVAMAPGDIHEKGLEFTPVVEINEASEMTYVRIYDDHYEPRRKELAHQETEAD